MKKLQCTTLRNALRSMKIGETCIAPDGYSVRAIIIACNRLREEGYSFTTSTKSGEQTITRLPDIRKEESHESQI